MIDIIGFDLWCGKIDEPHPGLSWFRCEVSGNNVGSSVFSRVLSSRFKLSASLNHVFLTLLPGSVIFSDSNLRSCCLTFSLGMDNEMLESGCSPFSLSPM